MRRTSDPLLRAACMDWHRMAPYAGFNPTAYAPEVLARRNTDGRARIVMRMCGTGCSDVVFKRVFRPTADPSWRVGLQTQRRLRTEMTPAARPAPVLFSDDVRQAAIFDWVPGKSLRDHLLLKMAQAERRTEVAYRAGSWLSDFHRATEAGHAAFHSAPVQLRMSRLMVRAETDPAAVVDADLFLVLAQGLTPFARAAHSAQVRCAARHGDLSASNLILGPNRATAIDFREARVGPVLFDIAALCADILMILPDRSDLQALETGYGTSFLRDPVFEYLLRCSLLKRWAGQGPLGQSRGAFAAARLSRLQQLAMQLLGPRTAAI